MDLPAAIAAIEPGLLSIQEATRRYGLHRAELYNLMNQKLIRWSKPPRTRSRLIHQASLVAYLAADYLTNPDPCDVRITRLDLVPAGDRQALARGRVRG